MDKDRRFIEESFPVKEVSVESAREKNIRHGHISTLHIWWSRKPLASSRASIYAALISPPDTIEEWDHKRQFIAEFSKWENSLNKTMIQRARKDILAANNGKPPKVLDPFGGGGAIPLEALRLGCETYSCDLNPVAVLIQKCTLEYPQKYGRTQKRGFTSGIMGTDMAGEREVNPLLEDVKRWGAWVLEQARAEIGQFYPEDPDGSIPVGYYWMRTVPCQNPTCGADIPLTANMWLAKKANKKVALFAYAKEKKVYFKIVGTGYDPMPAGFDPEKGTVARAVATCPVCGSTVDAKTTRRLFQEKKSGEKMVAVVLHKPGETGKRYRIAEDGDLAIFEAAKDAMKEKRETLMGQWGMDPVPDEPLTRVPLTFGVINVWVYGMNTWGDLFNARQKLALITFAEKVRQAYGEMMNAERGTRNAEMKGRGQKTEVGGQISEEYAKAVVAYLGLATDRIAIYCSNLGYWHVSGEKASPSMQRQAIGMVFDYLETISISQFYGWESHLDWIIRVLEHGAHTSKDYATVSQSSATALPYPDNHFDAIFTDPPYYDNVPYSYLSDFFYVWLKRTLGEVYPELFSTPLTPKKNEIVAYSNGPGGWEDGKAFFEDMLKKAFQEIHRVLRPDGIAVIVYAHKSTEGWETLINSLLDSGLIMTGAWPLNTEMAARLRAHDSATLASSIYIVARKMKRQATGFFNEVREELKQHLNRKLERLWQEGIGGADFFIAAIGSAIEVFGKYEKVMDYEGNIVRADRMLGDVRRIATDYAVRQILHNGFSEEISDLTRFYVLYRWNYGGVKVPFDEARKLAQSCSIDLASEWNRPGFIQKDKEFVKVLGPHERSFSKRQEEGFGGSIQSNHAELVDVLHQVLLFWEKGNRDRMVRLLQDSGYGERESFFRVAQAISETLPNENKEKKLLDGFLAGRERLRDEVRQPKPGSLF
jgi:adenine-specific DNA methylase